MSGTSRPERLRCFLKEEHCSFVSISPPLLMGSAFFLIVLAFQPHDRVLNPPGSSIRRNVLFRTLSRETLRPKVPPSDACALDF